MRYKIVNRNKRWATGLADLIGATVFLPARLRRAPPIRPEAVRRILVIRTAYIGDVVMTLPLLKPLKDRFPDARITFLTAPAAAELLAHNPFLDEVLTYAPFWFYRGSPRAYVDFVRRLRQETFDLVVETRADIRDIVLLAWPAKSPRRVSYGVGGGAYALTHVVPYPGLKHKVEYHLDLARYLGCPTDPLEWGIYLTAAERACTDARLAGLGVRPPFLCAHPGSRLALKRWLPERYAAAFDRLMHETRLPLLLCGTEAERSLTDDIRRRMTQPAISLVGALTLREFAGLVARAALFVCNDSGPMHVAAAMQTPTVALFGPSKSVETAPYGPRHRVVEKAFPCRPACDESTCHFHRFHACMHDIEVDDVVRAARVVLEQSMRQ